jgi:hypothetical protein
VFSSSPVLSHGMDPDVKKKKKNEEISMRITKEAPGRRMKM